MTTERDEELMAADGVTSADYDDLLNGSDEVDDGTDDDQDDAAGGDDAAGVGVAAAVGADGADAGRADPAAASPAAADDGLDEEVTPSLPAVEPVADLEGKLTTIDASVEALGEKFADAEMSQAEYSAELKKLQDSRDALVRQAARADLAAEAADRAWSETCNRFWVRTKEAEGIDYLGNTALMTAIDAEVKRLASDPANAQQNGPFFLRQAHANIKAAFGIKDAAPAPTPAPAAGKGKTSRAPDLSGIPPNLAKLPPAGTDAPGASKWDSIAALPAAKQEQAIARMSQAELDEYMDNI